MFAEYLLNVKVLSREDLHRPQPMDSHQQGCEQLLNKPNHHSERLDIPTHTHMYIYIQLYIHLFHVLTYLMANGKEGFSIHEL